MNPVVQQIIAQYGPVVLKGAGLGAAAGLAYDFGVWRGWVGAIDFHRPQWSDDILAEVRAYNWRQAARRAGLGAALGLTLAFSPWFAGAIGLTGLALTGTKKETQ